MQYAAIIRRESNYFIFQISDGNSFLEELMSLKDRIPQKEQATSKLPANEKTEDQIEIYEEISPENYLSIH